MEKLIVYIDDADYALHMLQPMLGAEGRTPTQWLLVACAPRVSRHVSKWVSHSAREGWRADWAQKTFARLTPLLAQQGDQVNTQVGQTDLVHQTGQLLQQHGQARVLDARRPKFGHDLAPVTLAQSQDRQTVLGMAAALAGAGLLMAAD